MTESEFLQILAGLREFADKIPGGFPPGDEGARLVRNRIQAFANKLEGEVEFE